MSVNFTVGLLCYNSREETMVCLPYLVDECLRLKGLADISLNLVVVDNGTDATGCDIYDHLQRCIHPFTHVTVLTYPQNIGQSAGRNQIIEHSLESDYILFLDSDIRVVPCSFGYMVEHLIAKPKVGCITPHPARQTRNPEVATKRMEGIEFILNDCMTACTGYGVYRTDVFRARPPYEHTGIGIRFEDRGPFSGPGWGLEDDDIYLQLTTAGWGVDYFVGIIYLQRKPRSSWKFIEQSGVNVHERFAERKAFFLEKWRTNGIDPAILLTVKAQDLANLRA